MSLNIVYERKTEDIGFRVVTDGKHKLKCGPHLHQELELVYLKEGKTTAYADSIGYTLSRGDLFLTFPNQIHSYETLEQENYVIFIIKPILLPEFEQVFSLSLPGSAVLRNVKENFPHIPLLVDLLAKACEKQPVGDYDKYEKRGLLLALFSEILEHLPLTGLPKEDSDTLRKILGYCSRNFSGPLSLSSVGDALHMNKYYISHLFGEKLGMHFPDYVNSLRISEACRYLLNSEHTVTEISELVGFETLRTFNRAFIKQTGVSPSEFRKGNAKRKKN